MILVVLVINIKILLLNVQLVLLLAGHGESFFILLYIVPLNLILLYSPLP